MRQEKIPTKFSLSFPLPDGKPDGNGVVYTEEAVEKALSEMPAGLPIICRSKTGELVKIGYICNRPSTIKYCADHTIRFEVEGIINAGGTECEASVNRNADTTIVTDFKITAIGLCGE